MKRVISLGEILVDMISEDGIQYEFHPGGASANVAVGVAKLGGNALFLGGLSQDSFGVKLKNYIEQNKVDTSYVKYSGKTTLAFVSLDEHKERSFEFYEGNHASYHLKKEELGLTKDDLVHFGSAMALLGGKLKKSYFRLLEEALENKSFISFDPNVREVLLKESKLKQYHKDCWYFMKRANLIKLSEEELYFFTHTTILEEAILVLTKKVNTDVLITLGSKGTLVLPKVEIIKSKSITQIDSTGAGDAFMAGVLTSLSDGNSLIDAITYGNAVGALTCTKKGAMEALPTKEEVVLFMNQS